MHGLVRVVQARSERAECLSAAPPREGLNVVKNGRMMIGATKPEDSVPGSIRGDLCIQVRQTEEGGQGDVDLRRIR